MTMIRISLLISILLPTAVLAQPASSVVRLPVSKVNEVVKQSVGPFEIEGFMPGNVPVAVEWTEVTIDTSAGLLWMAGTVVQPTEGVPLAGVRLVAGELVPAGESHRLAMRAGAVADENGRFSISWTLRSKDVLLITMLGHLEARLSVGPILALPPQLRKEGR